MTIDKGVLQKVNNGSIVGFCHLATSTARSVTTVLHLEPCAYFFCGFCKDIMYSGKNK